MLDELAPAADFGLADFDSPVDEAGALSVRAISARRCPYSEDTDASFTPTELRSVDEAGALSVRAVSARRCPDSEDTDASFTPTGLHSVDAAAAS